MAHDLRMRLTWHFEVASLGCLNRKADMLVELLEKIGHRLLFFSPCPRKLSHAGCGNKTSVASGKDALNGDEWVDSQWRCTARSGGTDARCKRCVKTDRILEEAEVFFPPPLLLLSCQVLLSFSAGACHKYGDGPEVASVRAVFSKWTFNCLLCGCTNI